MALQLKPDEQAWLEEYSQALRQNYPGVVADLVVFDAQESDLFIPDYTVNVVVILKEGNRQTIKDVDSLGYSLSALSDAIPFIWVYTKAEWQHRRQKSLLPYKGDGVTVWSNH